MCIATYLLHAQDADVYICNIHARREVEEKRSVSMVAVRLSAPRGPGSHRGPAAGHPHSRIRARRQQARSSNVIPGFRMQKI